VIPNAVYDLAQQMAGDEPTWFRPAHIAKNAGLSKEESIAYLDAMTEDGLLTREWDCSCPSCARTLQRGASPEEARQLDRDDCWSCGEEIAGREWVEPVYTPTDKLRGPEMTALDTSPRARTSPLAERRNEHDLEHEGH
jgi:hypothetical protein